MIPFFSLCTIFGDIIFEPNELQHGYVYVALPYNEKFVDMDYLSYFNELEDSYKKKGLLLSIRPAQEKKYGKKIPKLKTVKKKKKLQMEGKKSVTNSDAGDGVQIRSQVQIGDKTAENECQCDPFNTCMNSAKTQTLHNVQDDAVVNSQLHNGNSIKYVNKSVQIRKKKNQTAVPTSGLTTKMDRFSGETKRTENKPEPITQRDSGLKDTTDINTSTPVIKANKSDIKEKAIEHFSISVVVSKTTKVVNEIKTEHNISNLDLSKTCQACTYCTNIAVSGTCSNKLEVITNIINDVIIDTYKRLMQTDDLKKDVNLVPIEDTTKKSITINGGGSVTDSKVERISAGNVDSATDEVKENSIVAPTMKEAKNISEKNKISATDTIRDKETKEKLSIVQDMKDTMEFSKINSSKPSGSKNYKVNESNYIYSGCGHVPSVHIKNKTYFNFCDLKSCPRNSCKDIRIRYCKKSSSDLDKTCYLYEMTPKVKEFQCNSCTAAPVDEIDMMDRFSKGEKQDISKTIKKKTVLYKSVSEKVQLGSVTTQTQTQSKIQSGLYMYSQGTAEKPIQDSMSLDSISGDVSDTKINEPTKKEDTNDIQDESEQLKYRDEVSIAVNISKVNGSKNPFEDHKISEQYLKTETPVNTERGNEISISKVTSNASFLEKLTYIKDIINSILKEVFELQNNEALKTEGIESITKKQENGNIHSDSRAQKDITENSTVGVSNYSNKDTSKMTFNKMDEHQSNIEIPVAKPKKLRKSKPSKCKPVQICPREKSRKKIFDIDCRCEPKMRVSECCICPKYPPIYNNNNTIFERASVSTRKKVKASEDGITTSRSKAIDTMEETVKDRKVSASTLSRQGNEVVATNEKSFKTEKPERKSEISERKGTEELDLNNQSIISRNSAEDIGKRSVQIERVFYSKSREREKNGGSESEVCSSESEISIDSIEDSACCICVCPVKYKFNLNGVKK